MLIRPQSAMQRIGNLVFNKLVGNKKDGKAWYDIKVYIDKLEDGNKILADCIDEYARIPHHLSHGAKEAIKKYHKVMEEK